MGDATVVAQPAAHEIGDIAALRDDIEITRHFAYFQTGSYGPLPDSTQRFMAEMLREENLWGLVAGGPVRSPRLAQHARQARQVVAHFLGVAEDNLAWTNNTSTGTRLAVRSLHWQRGDKLAVSDVEHKSTAELVSAMKSLLGVETTVIPSGDGGAYSPAFFLEQMDRLLTPDHRMLILSHVANTDGRRLPVKAAVRLARQRGVCTLVDGAQAVGVFPVDVGDIDADFYSGSAHKWLLGPAGVGFLAVRGEQLPHYNPLWKPPVDESDVEYAAPTPRAGYLSEIGTPNNTLRMGAAYAIGIFQRIGMAAIEDHIRRLSDYLRHGIGSIPGARVAGPADWAQSSAITSIQFPGLPIEQIRRIVLRLREEHAICVKVRPEIDAIRVAVAPFNIAAEIDRLLDALASLRKEM